MTILRKIILSTALVAMVGTSANAAVPDKTQPDQITAAPVSRALTDDDQFGRAAGNGAAKEVKTAYYCQYQYVWYNGYYVYRWICF